MNKIPPGHQLPIIYTAGGEGDGRILNSKFYTFSRLKRSQGTFLLIMILSDPPLSQTQIEMFQKVSSERFIPALRVCCERYQA